MLNQIADNLWELDRPLKVMGLQLGHRMTVARLRDGGLWIHSPVEHSDELGAALKKLGPVRHLIAPSCYHDLYWPEWFAHFPEACFYCAPGTKEQNPNLPFRHVLTTETRETWEDELPKGLVAGMPRINEFVFLHRASRTLIVADLVFNLDVNRQNAIGQLLLKINGIYGRGGCSRIFRHYIKDRAAFRTSVDQLLTWDFDRLIPGHGGVVHTDGKPVLQAAMDWLKP